MLTLKQQMEKDIKENTVELPPVEEVPDLDTVLANLREEKRIKKANKAQLKVDIVGRKAEFAENKRKRKEFILERRKEREKKRDIKVELKLKRQEELKSLKLERDKDAEELRIAVVGRKLERKKKRNKIKETKEKKRDNKQLKRKIRRENFIKLAKGGKSYREIGAMDGIDKSRVGKIIRG